jgi:hypothetical protein
VDHEKLATEFNENIKAEIEGYKTGWEADKKALADEKAKLQKECIEIQEKIKNKKG